MYKILEIQSKGVGSTKMHFNHSTIMVLCLVCDIDKMHSRSTQYTTKFHYNSYVKMMMNT